MRMTHEFLERLDWKAAIEQTIPARGEFFPSRVEANAAKASEEAVVGSLKSRLGTDRDLGPAQVVYVPRRTIGTRPAFDVSFEDRVIIAALALALMEAVAPYRDAFRIELGLEGPTEGTYREFERRPLEDEDARAIVIADVAAFYEYVDHRLLADEILELTGDIELSSAVSVALAELVSRGFGMPQGPRGSDVFADFYLTQVDRRLARAGITAYRHNDEFRLPVRRIEDGVRVLVRLEEELRNVGLVLNPAKTRTPLRRQYEGWLQRLDEEVQHAPEVDAEDTEWIYGFDPADFAEGDAEELDVEQVENSFEAAIAGLEEDDYPGLADRLIVQYLPLLAIAESTTPLPHVRDLVRSRPWLIRPLSLYLRGLAGTEEERAMIRTVSGLLRSDVYLLPWVRGWLLDPLAHCVRRLPPALLEHIRACMHSYVMPWFVRGRAAIVLATEGQLPNQEMIARLFDEAPPPTRADVVAAVVIQEPEWAEQFLASLAGENHLLDAVPSLIRESGHRAIV